LRDQLLQRRLQIGAGLLAIVLIVAAWIAAFLPDTML
jgi:hypothetical protein